MQMSRVLFASSLNFHGDIFRLQLTKVCIPTINFNLKI